MDVQWVAMLVPMLLGFAVMRWRPRHGPSNMLTGVLIGASGVMWVGLLNVGGIGAFPDVGGFDNATVFLIPLCLGIGGTFLWVGLQRLGGDDPYP